MINYSHDIAMDLIHDDINIREENRLAHELIIALRLCYIHAAYRDSKGEMYSVVESKLLQYVNNNSLIEMEAIMPN